MHKGARRALSFMYAVVIISLFLVREDRRSNRLFGGLVMLK
jgi:hypothetical protein